MITKERSFLLLWGRLRYEHFRTGLQPQEMC